MHRAMKMLTLKPYHFYVVHKLKPGDPMRRTEYCYWFIRFTRNSVSILDKENRNITRIVIQNPYSKLNRITPLATYLWVKEQFIADIANVTYMTGNHHKLLYSSMELQQPMCIETKVCSLDHKQKRNLHDDVTGF